MLSSMRIKSATLDLPSDRRVMIAPPTRFALQGYTLVELMIAISLGLIVVAAAMAVLLSAQRLLRLQNAMDELQQNASLAVGLISFDLRQSNLNMATQNGVNNKSLGSGIIFSAANLPASMASNASAYQKLWTQQDSGVAATEQKSDQLLIQYLPEYELVSADDSTLSASSGASSTQIYRAGFDCEGKKIEFSQPRADRTQSAATAASAQRIIVNRYYLKKDPQQVKGEPSSYSLFCQSGHYVAGDQQITGLTAEGGQQVMKRVDAFKLRLGVKAPDGKRRYLSINQYLALMPPSLTQPERYYNIVSIELGLLVRSSTALGTELLNPDLATKPADAMPQGGQQDDVQQQGGQQIDLQQAGLGSAFELLGTKLKLQQAQQSKKYLRQNITQVVALRNAVEVQGAD